jgi:WD40 repeat protein
LDACNHFLDRVKSLPVSAQYSRICVSSQKGIFLLFEAGSMTAQKIGSKAFILSVLVLVLSACNLTGNLLPPTSTVLPTISPTHTISSLPDLAIKSLAIEPEEGNLCDDPSASLGIRIQIENLGNAATGPFFVVVNNVQQYIENGLAAGESRTLWFKGFADENKITIDPTGSVIESDKKNNQVTRKLEVPVLSPDCQPKPTPLLLVDQPLYTLEGHTAQVLSVVFSPDGSLVASGSVDDTMRLWRTKEGTLLRTMQGHPFPILSLAFSPNGALLASGSYDGLVRIWRVSDGRLVQTLEGHAGRILSLGFSPSGNTLVSCSDDFTVRLWRMLDGKLLRTIDEGMATINDITFSPDGNLLAWAEANGNVRVWRISNEAWVYIFKDASQAASSVTFSPDGNLLVSGFSDGRIRIWQMSDGTQVQTLPDGGKNVSSLAFSPDGNLLVAGSADGMLRLWQFSADVTNVSLLRVFAGHTAPVNSVAFSPKGDLIASASDDSTVRLWQVPEPIPPEGQ